MVGCAMLQVTVFSTTEKKKEEALKTLGADHFIISKDEDAMNVSFWPVYLPLHQPFITVFQVKSTTPDMP